jgi:alanyl-tRNA synthetase
VEIWNLVFTQFDRQSDGTLKDLPQRNIDTGMGLERTAAVLQGVSSNFEIDVFKTMREELRKLLGPQNAFETTHENAVMDHIRAIAFSIADGALPSNEGRGYVVRKLIRLAGDHLRKAGSSAGAGLHRLVPAVAETMGAAYPEIRDSQKNIQTLVEREERSYLEVLRTQTPRLRNELAGAGSNAGDAAAEIAFKYYDTFGLPYETIEGIAGTLGILLDRRRFDTLLDRQKQRSREKSKIAGEIFSKDHAALWVEGLPESEFLGYDCAEAEGTLLRILKNQKPAEVLKAGEEAVLIFDRTPFYAEAGGQVGDTGELSSRGFKAAVLDTQWMEKCIAHRVSAAEGEIRAGQRVRLCVNAARRDLIMKNHTATHLLHSALRKVLGEHVKQSGSLVAPDRLRFDFTHFKALDSETLARVEELVNEQIRKDLPLNKNVMSKEEAIREGAIAFFGEKYADAVRVVTIGEFSKELCGGTHLRSAGEIGLFKILSESSIQAGVRRIEAATGPRAAAMVEDFQKEWKKMARFFRADEETLPQELGRLEAKVSGLKNRLFGSLNRKVGRAMEQSFKKSSEVAGIKVVVGKMDRADVELLKGATDHLKSLHSPFAALLSSESDDKISFVVAASDELVRRGFHSGKIVKDIAALVQGNGGGRPDFAVGGGKMLAKKKEAIALGETEIRRNLESIGKSGRLSP